MADQIQVAFAVTGETMYAILRDMSGQPWNGSSFEAYQTANLGTYDLPLTEQGTASKHYVVAFPSGISAGRYLVTAFVQASGPGGDPAESDDPGPVLPTWYDWNGTNIIGVAD